MQVTLLHVSMTSASRGYKSRSSACSLERGEDGSMQVQKVQCGRVYHINVVLRIRTSLQDTRKDQAYKEKSLQIQRSPPSPHHGHHLISGLPVQNLPYYHKHVPHNQTFQYLVMLCPCILHCIPIPSPCSHALNCICFTNFNPTLKHKLHISP